MGAATENIPMSKHAEKIYVGTFHAALGLMSEANFIIAPYAQKASKTSQKACRDF